MSGIQTVFDILDPIIEAIAQKRNFPPETVRDVVHKIHRAEYKRRQTPISLRVTQKAFDKGRYVPIVQKWK